MILSRISLIPRKFDYISRTPVWSAENGVQRTNEVHKCVAHQEEEVHDGGDRVHRPEHYSQPGDKGGEHKSVEGLVLLGDSCKRTQKGDHVVLGN